MGAALQAQSCTGQMSPAARIGFYSGQIGIAHTLIELAELLENEDLLTPAFALLDALGASKDDSQMLNVISGSAGAIPALLNIYRKYPRETFLQTAVREGENLLRTAKKHDTGFSWTTIEMPN